LQKKLQCGIKMTKYSFSKVKAKEYAGHEAQKFKKLMAQHYGGVSPIKHSCMKHKIAIDMPNGYTKVFCSLCNKELGEFS